MLNLYKYNFKTWVVTKDGQRLLLGDDTQQLFLKTEEEAKEIYLHRYSFKEWGGGYFYICKGFKYYRFYRSLTDDYITKIKIDNFKYIEVQRTFVPATFVTLKNVFNEVKDVHRVIEFLNQKRLTVEEIANLMH